MEIDDNVKPTNFVPDNIYVGGAPVVQGWPQCELGYLFFNGLGVTVTVITRTGVQIQIPPLPGSRYRGFVVRTTYATGHGVIVNTSDLSNDQGLTTSKEAKSIESAIFRDEIKFGGGPRPTATVDYVLSSTDFDRNSGAVYLTNLDLTISTLNPYYVPKHPYSLVGQRLALIEGAVSPTLEAGLVYRVRIVDRQGRFGDRFVNLGGEVYYVKACTDEELNDGVYLTSSMPSTGSTTVALPRTVFYAFEEADKALSLYLSAAAAKTLGDPKSERDRELGERAHELKLLEADIRRERIERDVVWETKKREWEVERETAKQTLMAREDLIRVQEQIFKQREQELSREEQVWKVKEQELKRELVVLKDELEKRSMGRKEVLEVVKYLPTLISGVGALYLVFKNLKK